MSTQDHENRIVKLEMTSDFHEKEISALKQMDVNMQKSLTEIRDILKQVKWVAVGALAMFIAEKTGLAKPLLAML